MVPGISLVEELAPMERTPQNRQGENHRELEVAVGHILVDEPIEEFRHDERVDEPLRVPEDKIRGDGYPHHSLGEIGKRLLEIAAHARADEEGRHEIRHIHKLAREHERREEIVLAMIDAQGIIWHMVSHHYQHEKALQCVDIAYSIHYFSVRMSHDDTSSVAR